MIGLVLHLVAGPTHVVALTDRGETLAWEQPDLVPVEVPALEQGCYTLVAVSESFRCITAGGDYLLDPSGAVRRGGRLYEGGERVAADVDGVLPGLMRDGVVVDGAGDQVAAVQPGAESRDLSPDRTRLATAHSRAGERVPRVVLQDWPGAAPRWALELEEDPAGVLFLDDDTLLVRTATEVLRVATEPLPFVLERLPVGGGTWARDPHQARVVVAGASSWLIGPAGAEPLVDPLAAAAADPAGGLIVMSASGELRRLDTRPSPGPEARGGVEVPPGSVALGRRLIYKSWWQGTTAPERLEDLHQELLGLESERPGSLLGPGPSLYGVQAELVRLGRHLPHDPALDALRLRVATLTVAWNQHLRLWGVAVLLAALLGVLVLPRVRRLSLGSNPLDAHGPRVPSTTPFGGLPVVDEVLATLVNNRVVITAEEGGSVLLSHLVHRLETEGLGGEAVEVVRLDLAGCREDVFWARLARALADQVEGFPWLEGEVGHAHLLRALRRHGRRAAARRIVLVLGNLDVLETYVSAQQQFRGLLQTLPAGQVTVLAQALPGIGQGEVSPDESPWYNHFLVREPGGLSVEETRAWLAARVTSPLQLAPDLPALVHALSGGHPLRTWRCAQAMVDEALIAGSRVVRRRHLFVAPGLVEEMMALDRHAPGPGRRERLLALREALGGG